MKRVLVTIAAIACAASLSRATTRLPSADGQFWDIQDTSPWAQDSGGIATGGGANPFNGFGYLKLDVRTAGGATLAHNVYLRGFGLAYDGAERFDSITPVLVAGVAVDRGIFAPRDTNYLRYVDSFTNTTARPRLLQIAWGGAAGAFDDGGRVTIAATSSGDRTIGPGDGFVTVMQNARRAGEPLRGPSGHGPSAHVLGTRTAGPERYGGEPGTCEPSAMTGLPQVTVPAGFLGGRYPFGVSFLGRRWSDGDLLALAHAYEQATRHRRPPGTAPATERSERRERERSGGA